MRLTACACALLASTAIPAVANNTIPDDAESTCTVDDATFASWFASGSASANGAVKMPDSFTQDFMVPCDFYKWGAQMFLHLTSPTPGVGTGKAHVLNSASFFTAVDDGTYPPNDFAAFEIERNVAGDPSEFALRGRKSPDAAQAGGGESLINQGNDVVYFGIHINDVYAGFADAEAKYPDLFNFDFTPSVTDPIQSQDNFPVTSDEALAVLIYGILSGYVEVSQDVKSEVQSVMTAALGLDAGASVADIAGTGASFAEAAIKAGADALAGAVLPTPIELKTSWITADSAIDGTYIEIEADVPTFTDRTDTVWTLDLEGNDTKLTTTTLVMTGMHIVAPVKDNPELAWMSFEHLSNNPLADYVYSSSTAGGSKTVPYSGDGSWNFAPATSTQPDNVTSNAKVDSGTGNLVTDNNAPKIEAVNVALMNPWGLQNATEEPTPDSNDLSNINDVIALNSSLLTKLGALNDPRAQYFMIGGLWSHAGIIPTGDGQNEVGGLYLANSTMETFHQANAQGGGGPQNCFACHSISPTSSDGTQVQNPGTGVSHIFGGITYRINNPDQ